MAEAVKVEVDDGMNRVKNGSEFKILHGAPLKRVASGRIKTQVFLLWYSPNQNKQRSESEQTKGDVYNVGQVLAVSHLRVLNGY